MCPKDEFTLTKLKELNLDETPQSLEAVTKVCDVAGKEYAIEQVTRSPNHGTHPRPSPHTCWQHRQVVQEILNVDETFVLFDETFLLMLC